MRIYTHLTHFAQGPTPRTKSLKTHLELTDDMGDSVKASGVYDFSLYRSSSLRPDGVRLKRWRVEVRDLEQHQRFYDPATQTYRFYLTGLSEADVSDSEEHTLRVDFTPSEGTLLDAEATLRLADDGDVEVIRPTPEASEQN